MKKNILVFCLIVWVVSCTNNSHQVHDPYFVGRPPQNAYTGLVKINDSDIRHYGKDCYIISKDGGLSWQTVPVEDGNLYGKQSQVTGEFCRVFSVGNDAVYVIRSIGGIDGEWVKEQIDTNGAIMIKPVVYIQNGSRAIAAFHTKYRNGCGTYYSDDNCKTWKKSNQVNAPDHKVGGLHRGERWNHGAVEPSVVELQNGNLWMLMRTAQDMHYESFSTNGGETWSEPKPSRFYGTITMPTIQRLSDGRILFLWCNTTPLPEVKHPDSYWEDVFTNRDAIHAAISDDDGKNWQGFRELYLNPLRNDSLMATRFGKMGSNDRSVHQSEFVETGDGEILVSLGQHPEFRSLIKFNPEWLYEKERADVFSDGLSNWSCQKYIKGIEGHCAYNRIPGAFVMQHPDKPGKNVMHLKADYDSTLLSHYSGAVFNFPAGENGELTFRAKFTEGYEGMTISLCDRWFNPTDSTAMIFAMHNFEIPANLSLGKTGNLGTSDWHDFKLKWIKSDDLKSGYCSVYIDGKKQDNRIPLNCETINGISYIHFYLTLKNTSNTGVFIESIYAKVK